MNRHLGTGRALALAFISALVVVLTPFAPPAIAAAPTTGSSQTVVEHVADALGGTAVSGCGDCWTDSNSFEPRDAVKGDVARMLFYMAIRSEGGDGFSNLEMSSTVGSSSSQLGDLEVLMAWNVEDPVSAFEMRRNDRIHSTWQGNRNPFIDHPEWARAIWN